MRRLVLIGMVGMVAACRPQVAPDVLREYQSRSLVTCCNIHYESEEISDANYFVGSTLSLGTPVQVQGLEGESVTFVADGKKLRLYHRYGTAQESLQQYVNKILVADSPRTQLARFPHSVQRAIQEARVEKGMTREQVIMALGYPPTHRTASTTANEWIYWYNRWRTYKVQFDEQGVVSNVIGRPAPTQDKPIEPDPVPERQPAQQGKGKKRK